MRRTACDICQPVCRLELGIELIALGLRAVVLPIWRIGVGEGRRQLLDERLVRLQAAQERLGLSTPVHAPMLLARATDAPDTVQRCVVLLQAIEDQVNGLEPQGDGCKHLTLVLLHQDAFCDAIFGAEVAVEVDFCLGDDLEVGLDDDGWSIIRLAGWPSLSQDMAGRGSTPLSCWVDRSNPR